MVETRNVSDGQSTSALILDDHSSLPGGSPTAMFVPPTTPYSCLHKLVRKIFENSKLDPVILDLNLPRAFNHTGIKPELLPI